MTTAFSAHNRGNSSIVFRMSSSLTLPKTPQSMMRSARDSAHICICDRGIALDNLDAVQTGRARSLLRYSRVAWVKFDQPGSYVRAPVIRREHRKQIAALTSARADDASN